MKKPLVTIVMPVYNVALYIERALLSAIRQTYSNLEIILVDDCGKDDSIQIAEQIIAQYDTEHKVRILHHDHNRGLSAARNTGLDNMQGEYVYFMDSDDAITEDCIEDLEALAEKYPKAEIIQGSMVLIPAEENDWHDINTKIDFPDYTENKDWIMRHIFAMKNFIPVNACGKLISKHWIDESQGKLTFIEGIIHEDDRWIFDVSQRIRAIAFSCHVSYLHYRVEGSIMTSKAKSHYKSLYAEIRIIDDSYSYMNNEWQKYMLIYMGADAIETYLMINLRSEDRQLYYPYRKRLWKILFKSMQLGLGYLAWTLLITLLCPLSFTKGVRYIRRVNLQRLIAYQEQY